MKEELFIPSMEYKDVRYTTDIPLGNNAESRVWNLNVRKHAMENTNYIPFSEICTDISLCAWGPEIPMQITFTGYVILSRMLPCVRAYVRERERESLLLT